MTPPWAPRRKKFPTDRQATRRAISTAMKNADPGRSCLRERSANARE
jgi:hypothetical protein